MNEVLNRELPVFGERMGETRQGGQSEGRCMVQLERRGLGLAWSHSARNVCSESEQRWGQQASCWGRGRVS